MSNGSAIAEAPAQDRIKYEPLPTLRLFHDDNSIDRCIVGEVGSGKTTAAAMEIGAFIPQFLLEKYGITKTRWAVVRNSYIELRDTTLRTVREWFPGPFLGKDWSESKMQLTIRGPGYEAELLFRSCDRPEDLKKFKSLEITGYWIDESIEVPQEIKLMLQSRRGRFPKKCPEKYGIETTNPPEVEHPTYSDFAWQVGQVTYDDGSTSPAGRLPPGPLPSRDPLADHHGFWQRPRENVKNLSPGYYEDLRKDYYYHPDWIDTYLDGKPGVMVVGKLVYHNFKRAHHVAKEPIPWTGGELILGWDNTGNSLACVVLQVPAPMQVQVLREFYTDRAIDKLSGMGLVDFTQYVIFRLNQDFQGTKEITHWGDPAASAEHSKAEGGFTSNVLLMHDCGVDVAPSEQNMQARIEAVDQQLARIDGLLIDPGCTRLINGFLGGYCYPPNKSLMGEFLPNILKNKYSHVHDALQYAMVRVFKPDLRPDARDPVLNFPLRDHYNPLEGTGYNPFNWRPGRG